VSIADTFTSINLTHPVGSASISQVHEGVLRSTGQRVAVKVQYPDAEAVMLSDLSNLRKLAAFLQKHELPFDLVSPGKHTLHYSARNLSKMQYRCAARR
jgi:predicted unusual protein kinase regulating ubiquinone biosynthesis (AarF/ABC1/UbiB family)